MFELRPGSNQGPDVLFGPEAVSLQQLPSGGVGVSEHFLQSYSRLLDLMVNEMKHFSTTKPAEIVDRIDAGYEALITRFESNELAALLAIAIDRLAMQGVVS